MRDAFKPNLSFDNSEDVSALRGGDRFDWGERAYYMLAAETERQMRKVIERGAGWNLWRSHPKEGGDPFVIKHDFQIVPVGALVGAGILFVQPELSDGERVRLLAGRHDWKDDRWEDHCGVLDCGHDCCEAYRYAG